MKKLTSQTPSPVVRDDRNLAGAFGMAFVGLMLGIFGMHRYYLKQRIYGTLLSSVFLLGVLALVHFYAGLVNSAISGLLSFDAAGGSFQDIPDISSAIANPPAQVYIGTGLCVVGVLLFLGDLLLLPSSVKKYRAGKL